MFYKKYEDYLKEYLNKDISIKSVKPHEEKIFNEFQAKAILDSNSETLREEFHFVLDLISSRKEVNEEKTNDLKKSFERMIQGIDPSDYNALRFSIYKSRMMVLKENIRERETSSKEVPPTFTSNTSLQASDELVSPKLVAEQEKRFAEQATLNKRDNGKQEALSNEQIKENVATYVNLAHTTNQSTKEEQHQRPKVSDLKERFEKERSYNKEPHSAEVPSGTVNRLRQYYEGLNHSTNDHSPLESRKSSRWRTSQTNDSPNVQNRQNQPTDRQNQRNEGTSSYQKSPPLKGTSEFVRRGYERTVYTNESSPTNKAEPDQTGMTNEELQRRRDRFGNMPGPSNEPPVIKRTTQSEPDNYQTATYQNPPRQQRSSELVQEGQASRIDNNDSLRTNNAEWSQTGRANEEFQRYRDRFGNMPGPSNEPPVRERTTQSEPNNYQTVAYQNPPRQQRSSELVQEGQASRIDNNDSLRTNNAEWSRAGRTDEEFQNRRARFENLTSTSNEPAFSKKKGRGESEHQGTSYQRATTLHGSSEIVRKGNGSAVHTNDSASANETKSNQNDMTNEEFQNRRTRFENSSVKSDNHLASESTGRVKAVRDQFENPNDFSNERSIPEPTGQVRAARDRFEKANEFSNDRPVPESTGQVRAARDRFEKANEFSNNRPVPESTGRVKAVRDQFENPNVFSNERSIPEPTGRVKAASDRFEKANEFSNDRLAPESTGQVRAARDRFEKANEFSNDRPVPEPTGRVKAARDRFEKANEFSNDRLAPESTGQVKAVRDQFENPNAFSNEPAFSKKKGRGESEHQGTSYQRATTLHGSSEIVRKGNGSAVHTNDSASANETKSNQNDMTNEEFQNRRTRFENSSVKSDNHLASESTGRVKAVRDQFENPNDFSNERSIPEPTGQVRAARDRFEKANEFSNDRPVPESTGQVRAARDRFEKANEFSNNRPVPESTGRVKAVRDQFENPNVFSNERSIPEPTGRVKAASDRFEKANEFSNDRLAPESTGQVRAARDRFEKANEFSNDRPVPEPTGRVKAARDRFEKANEFSNDRLAPESTGQVKAVRDQFENPNAFSNEPAFSKKKGRGESEHQGTSYQRATTLHGSSEIVRKGNGSAVHTNDSASANETKSNQNDMTNEEFQNRRTRFENSSVKSDNHLASESTGRVRVARERFEKANALRDERPAPESTGRVRAARERFEKANALRDERPAPESTGRVKAASDQFEKANDHPNERPAPESTGRVEAMRRQYESRTGRETEASDSNETFQQKQNGLANERFRQRQNQFENPAGTSSDGPKSEETVIADQLDRRKETSNQPTVHSADQTDITDIAAGNTKKIRELLADKLKFNPEEKVPPETNSQTNNQTDSSHASVEESSSDTQNSQMRNQMSEGGEPKPTKLDEASIVTRGMDKKRSENTTDSLDKLGIDASSDTFGLNENASGKTDKATETDFMDDDVELPESGPLTEKKKIHTKKSRAIQIGRLLLNLLPLASWPFISMWVTGILGIVPAYLAMYGLPLTLFIYGTILAAVYGPKLINYIRKLRSRIQNYRQAERSRQRNLEDRVIDPKEKSIQRETAAHEKETAKTKQQNHSSEKDSPENSEKDKSVKGYLKRNWKSLAIIFGVGIVVAGIGIALTPVIAPYIFTIATSTPLFMYKVTSVIAMALGVSFGVTALSKGLHALQRKFYKKEDQTLETTTQKETIEKNSFEVDKNFDKAYEKVDKDDRASAHDNSSIKSAGSKEDGIKLASNETKSMEKSPYAWGYGQETENKTPNESNRSSRSNSFNTHETLHVKADIHEPPSQSSRENRATNQLGEAARHRLDNTKSERNPQITEQNKGINRQPAVKEAFDSIKQKAISKSHNASGKPLLKGQISFEK